MVDAHRRGLLLGAGAVALGGFGLSACARASGEGAALLNVSYDPTREFYRAYNELFAKTWAASGGAPFEVEQSHGGSGKQARSVIDGLAAMSVSCRAWAWPLRVAWGNMARSSLSLAICR